VDEPASEGPALTAGAAARRLGVAVATLRSWDRRYGLSPHGHTPGAHRRYSPADMVRLESLCRLVGEGVAVAEAAHAVRADHADYSESPLPRIGSDDLLSESPGRSYLPEPHRRAGGQAARGLARAAVRLDADRVLDLIEAAIVQDGVAAAWQQTIEPALLAVGRKWTEEGGRYVEVEHLLSWCVTVALHRVRPPGAVPGRSRGRGALLACAPDEWHSLPLEALAAALTQRGVPTRMLGAAVPRDALGDAVRRSGPARVVVWSHSPRTADASALARLPHPPGTRVFAAGPGWAGRQPPGITVLMSLPQAVEMCTV
jgi:MerR family transcriptional regulator, light-induced transcriptional regulator